MKAEFVRDGQAWVEFVMADPYHLNVPGPFYREEGCCLVCGVAVEEAPDLLVFDEDDLYSGCYVRKQPETAEETRRMLAAFKATEAECFRYRGDDPAVLGQLIIGGFKEFIDRQGEARRSNQKSEIYASDRAKRGGREQVLRRYGADGKWSLIVRRYDNGQYDFNYLERCEFGLREWNPMGGGGFYRDAESAVAAAREAFSKLVYATVFPELPEDPGVTG